jgi:hypothetical protein
MPTIPTLAKTEQNRYAKLNARINENLQLINKAFVQLASDLTEMRDRRLYFAGKYATFEEYCKKKLGRTRQHIYQIIRANDILQRLLAQGVPETELPATERLNRAIRDALRGVPLEQQDDALIPIWKATMRLAKQKDRQPTVIDVQEAAVEVIKSDATIERQQKELLSKFEGMARGLKIGLPFDTLSEDFRRRLTVALMAIAEGVTVLLAALESPAIEARSRAGGRKKPEEGHDSGSAGDEN